MADEVEAQAAPPGFTNENGDGIHIDVVQTPADNMEFTATVYSWSPVRVRVDDEGSEVPVTETSAPAGPTAPGVYTATFKYAAVGHHTVIAWNNTTSAEVEVFAGDIPAWNPDKYQKTVSQITAIEVQKAARIGGTTGVLNG